MSAGCHTFLLLTNCSALLLLGVVVVEVVRQSCDQCVYTSLAVENNGKIDDASQNGRCLLLFSSQQKTFVCAAVLLYFFYHMYVNRLNPILQQFKFVVILQPQACNKWQLVLTAENRRSRLSLERSTGQRHQHVFVF